MSEKIFNQPTQPISTGEGFGKPPIQPTQPGKKPRSKLKLTIVILVIVLVFGSLAFVFIMIAYPKYFKDTNKSVNQIVNSAVNTQANQNQNIALNQNINTIAKIPPSDIDTDKDGLTDLEEESLTTDPKKSDSDGDKYTDGDEIRNGFNPKGGGQLITTAGLYKSRIDEELSYLVFYPRNFQVKEESDGKKVEFIAPTDEIIDLVVEEAPANTKSALDYYLSKNPEIDKNNVKTITNWYKSLDGVLSVDGRSAYYLKDNKIFIITYHPAERPSYMSLFEMMYHSFINWAVK